MDKELQKKFEVAVAFRQRIYSSDTLERRWLNDGEIISFTLSKRNINNAEFCINDDNSILIWFSQLASVFLQINKMELVSGTIRLKNGTSKFIVDYNVNSFIEEVKNKKFKVTVNSDGNVARFVNAPSITSYESLEYYVNDINRERDCILNLLQEGKIEKAADKLQPTNEYDLEEV